MTDVALPALVVLLGPTAVGKTTLSLELCQRFDGEIIGADSRQVYVEMDIGTAKPTDDEMRQVPHHLVGFRQPEEPLTLAEYQQLAYAAIDAIHDRGGVPFLVGGSALYLRAVIEGLRIPSVAPNPQLRAELEAYLAQQGREALFARLQRVDPRTAAVIDGQNPRRVLRALEIFLSTGKSKLDLEGADPPSYRILQIGLDRPRNDLYVRIDRRVDAMIAAGLAAETQRLLDAGHAATLPAMTSLGYREIVAYLAGEMTLPEAAAKIKTETHRFVRHQATWFRKMPQVEWFDLTDYEISLERIAVRIDAFLT